MLSSTRSRETRLLGCERAIAVGGFVYLPFVAVALTEGEDVIDLLFGATYAGPAAPVLAWLATHLPGRTGRECRERWAERLAAGAVGAEQPSRGVADAASSSSSSAAT